MDSPWTCTSQVETPACPCSPCSWEVEEQELDSRIYRTETSPSLHDLEDRGERSPAGGDLSLSRTKEDGGHDCPSRTEDSALVAECLCRPDLVVEEVLLGLPRDLCLGPGCCRKISPLSVSPRHSAGRAFPGKSSTIIFQ